MDFLAKKTSPIEQQMPQAFAHNPFKKETCKTQRLNVSGQTIIFHQPRIP